MIKKLLALFAFSWVLILPLVAEQESKELLWYTRYNEALKQAKEQNKPLFVLFTGSDWCAWCQKFDQEVLNTPQFASNAEENFICLKIDFHTNLRKNPELFKEYQGLKARFGTRGFPSVLLLDKEEKLMGVTGYRAGGADSYIAHLSSLLEGYRSYSNKMQHVALEKEPLESLKKLYLQACELKNETDKTAILQAALERDKTGFFLTEQYRIHLANNTTNSSEALEIKRSLEDPNLDNHVDHMRFLAVAEFQERVEKGAIPTKYVLEPLLSFLENYGKQDKENAWKVQMVVSQYFSDNTDYQKAIEYAELALGSAPVEAQRDIQEAVKSLKVEMR